MVQTGDSDITNEARSENENRFNGYLTLQGRFVLVLEHLVHSDHDMQIYPPSLQAFLKTGADRAGCASLNSLACQLHSVLIILTGQ